MVAFHKTHIVSIHLKIFLIMKYKFNVLAKKIKIKHSQTLKPVKVSKLNMAAILTLGEIWPNFSFVMLTVSGSITESFWTRKVKISIYYLDLKEFIA